MRSMPSGHRDLYAIFLPRFYPSHVVLVTMSPLESQALDQCPCSLLAKKVDVLVAVQEHAYELRRQLG